jgi:hypothetical protein
VRPPRISQILDGAAEVIKTRGWHQGGFVPKGTPKELLGTCPVCVIAAINVACGLDPTEPIGGEAGRAAAALADYLGLDEDQQLTGELGDFWNDHPERTADEVIYALRACAEAEREELS